MRKRAAVGGHRPCRRPRADPRAARADFPLPAVQYSFGLDDGDAAGRRLSVRVEVCLRLQQYSFPFGLNLFNGRILATSPSAATWIVFKLPRDNSTDYIKRVIGLPGDEIQMNDGVLYINGQAVPKVSRSTISSRLTHGPTSGIWPRYQETLAERRELSRARSRRRRLRRQHRGLQGAARATTS